MNPIPSARLVLPKISDPLNFLDTRIPAMPHANAPREYGKSVRSDPFGSSGTKITTSARIIAKTAIKIIDR